MTGGRGYNYEDAGFNGFFRRTIGGNPTERSLKNVGAARAHKPQTINFDQAQTAGAMGDTFRVGKVLIKGGEARIDINDDEGNPVVRLGDQE